MIARTRQDVAISVIVVMGLPGSCVDRLCLERNEMPFLALCFPPLHVLAL